MRISQLLLLASLAWRSSCLRRPTAVVATKLVAGGGSKKGTTDVALVGHVALVGLSTATAGFVLYCWIEKASRDPRNPVQTTTVGCAYLIAAMGPLVAAALLGKTIPAANLQKWILLSGAYPALGVTLGRLGLGFPCGNDICAGLFVASLGGFVGTWLLGLLHYLCMYRNLQETPEACLRLGAFLLLAAFPAVASCYMTIIFMAFAEDFLR